VTDARSENTEPAGQGFETLALPWLEDVARFALSLTRDRSDADDLVQDTYLSAFRYWASFAPGNDPRKWLFAICRNLFVRSRQSRGRFIENSEGDVDAMPSVLDHIGAMHDGLGALFDKIDVRPAIERAVDALPEPHRSVLILVDVEGQRYDEAAETLGVAIGTIRSRLFRARREVQRALITHAQDAHIGTPHKLPSEEDDVRCQ
jgi:RNA polymerase sigma-70 factor (ECF subfamily)